MVASNDRFVRLALVLSLLVTAYSTHEVHAFQGVDTLRINLIDFIYALEGENSKQDIEKHVIVPIMAHFLEEGIDNPYKIDLRRVSRGKVEYFTKGSAEERSSLAPGYDITIWGHLRQFNSAGDYILKLMVFKNANKYEQCYSYNEIEVRNGRTARWNNRDLPQDLPESTISAPATMMSLSILGSSLTREERFNRIGSGIWGVTAIDRLNTLINSGCEKTETYGYLNLIFEEGGFQEFPIPLPLWKTLEEDYANGILNGYPIEIQSPKIQGQDLGQIVAVWDFKTREGEENQTTKNFTTEFKNALINNGSVSVFERRFADRLASVIENERSVQGVLEMSGSTLSDLNRQEVEQIVFGEVFDDIDSGEVTLTVTFQGLNGYKSIIRSVSFRRGLQSDNRARREKMKEFVDSIFSRAETASAPTASAGQTSRFYRVIQNDFFIDLQGCLLSQQEVTCRLLITNNGEDRIFRLITSRSKEGISIAYDDFNNEAKASRVQLANRTSGGNNFAEVILISGRPIEAIVIFEGISSQAAVLARVDFVFTEMETKTNGIATFRNVSLQR